MSACVLFLEIICFGGLEGHPAVGAPRRACSFSQEADCAAPVVYRFGMVQARATEDRHVCLERFCRDPLCYLYRMVLATYLSCSRWTCGGTAEDDARGWKWT